MQNLFEELQTFVFNQVIVNSLDYEIEIEGCILYGSRVTGFSRENSDIDALFIIKGIPEEEEDSWTMEHHGSAQILNKIMLTELRFYTSKSLRNMLNSLSLAQLNAISSGQVFGDSCGLLDKLKQASEALLSKAIDSLIEELKRLDISATINILKIHFSEAQNILLDSSSLDNPLCANARIIEYIIDFYVYGNRLFFANQLQKNSLIACTDAFEVNRSVLKNLLLLSEYRGARVLDFRKFTLAPSFQELTVNINKVLKHENYSFEYRAQGVFDLLNDFFLRNFKTNLILQTDEICQVILK